MKLPRGHRQCDDRKSERRTSSGESPLGRSERPGDPESREPRIPLCGGLRIGVERSETEHATVGDRKGAALELVDLNLVFTGTFAKVGNAFFDIGKAHQLCIAKKDRNDEAFSTTDGDSDIVEVFVNDVPVRESQH